MFEKLMSWPAILGAFAIALVLGTMGFKEHSEMSRLADHGRKAIAQIEEVNWTSKRGMDRNFDLTVNFTTEAGQAVKETLRVDTDTGKRARDDNDFIELPVVYLPQDPAIVRLEGETDASTRMFAIAAVLALGGLVLLVLRLRSKPAQG